MLLQVGQREIWKYVGYKNTKYILGKRRRWCVSPWQSSHMLHYPRPRSFRKRRIHQRFSRYKTYLDISSKICFHRGPCKIRAICWKPMADADEMEQSVFPAIPAAWKQLTFPREVNYVQNTARKLCTGDVCS